MAAVASVEYQPTGLQWASGKVSQRDPSGSKNLAQLEVIS